jgi:hypothetical protein
VFVGYAKALGLVTLVVAILMGSTLRVQLEEIASSEDRSTAQICEAFLKAGTDNYRKKRSKFIKGFIAQQKKDHPG